MAQRRLHQLQRDDGLDSELLTIYRDRRGQVPDISRMSIHRPNWPKRVTLAVLIGLGTSVSVYWAVAQLALRHGAAPAASLAVTLAGPTQLASGEDVTYRLTYRNADRVALREVTLTVRYPEGFAFRRSDPPPANQYHNAWQVVRLEPGEQGEIALTGKMVGAAGSLKTLAGSASYQPENFSARFSVEFSQTSQITSSILTLNLEAPPRVVADRPLTYTVTYANTSEQTFSGVLVDLDYPDGFAFRDAQPEPHPLPANLANFAGLGSGDVNGRWYLPTIAPNATGVITVNGGFPPALGGHGGTERRLVARLGLVDDTGGFSLQQEQRVASTLVEPNLQLTLIINGQASDQPVNAGETLAYRIAYKNLGQDTLSDVVIEASVASELADWSSLVDKNLGTREGSSLRWNRTALADLAEFNPLAEGTIDFLLTLKDADHIGGKTQDFRTVSTARATIGAIAGLPANLTVEAGPITNAINTSLTLTAVGRYFDDDNLAVGSGPLPPVVGEKTAFRLYWLLANTLHEAQRVTVTTTIAPDVAWEEKFLASTGQLTYDHETRQVTWTIPALPPRAASAVAAADADAWFDLAVTPQPGQVGKLLLLASESNLTATDAATGATIVGLQRSITSNLEDDPFGGGRGLVVEIGQ